MLQRISNPEQRKEMRDQVGDRYYDNFFVFNFTGENKDGKLEVDHFLALIFDDFAMRDEGGKQVLYKVQKAFILMYETDQFIGFHLELLKKLKQIYQENMFRRYVDVQDDRRGGGV